MEPLVIVGIVILTWGIDHFYSTHVWSKVAAKLGLTYSQGWFGGSVLNGKLDDFWVEIKKADKSKYQISLLSFSSPLHPS